MNLKLDFIDGHHAGPLFVPVKKRARKSKLIPGWDEAAALYRRAKPDWMSWPEVDKFWAESKRLTKATGVQHSVDHIVPLRNKIVCGLHVPWNLRIITLAENVEKSNAHWPDMPFEQLRLESEENET